jgi:hypothetical protein
MIISREQNGVNISAHITSYFIGICWQPREDSSLRLKEIERKRNGTFSYEEKAEQINSGCAFKTENIDLMTPDVTGISELGMSPNGHYSGQGGPVPATISLASFPYLE